jgi:N-acetyl-gamma-glutamyl-phosphate reductase
MQEVLCCRDRANNETGLMIEVAILGASGYSGLELLKMLLSHPQVRIVRLFGSSSSGKRIEDVHPSLRSLFSQQIEDFSEAAMKDIDVLFVALPSGQAMSLVPAALAAGSRIIDLGGDFRLNDPAIYEQYYGHSHVARNLLPEAVYGLTEWNCEAIRIATLVANPGCYPTSIQLALLPLLKENLLDSSSIGITSYSGTSGAGKSITEKMMFTEVHDSVRAYKVGVHQHIPEIRHYLAAYGGRAVDFTFVPHLLPVTRGIYTTIHATLQAGVGEGEIARAFERYYSSSPFVRVIAPTIPEMRDVLRTNFCDIGFVADEPHRSLVLFSAIDNLGKGAAGQAVQNMNLMFGLSQTEGLLPCLKKSS